MGSYLCPCEGGLGRVRQDRDNEYAGPIQVGGNCN